MYAASTVGREALAKRGLKGQMGGAFAFSAAAGGGESFTRILDETGEEAALTAIITGIASGGLDAVTPMRALKRILPQEQFKDAAEEVAGAVYRKRGVFSRALREAGKSGAAESVTETMQEIVQNGALEVVRGMGEDLEDSFIERMLDEGKLSQYKNAAVAGLVGGAGMGAFTGAIGQDPDTAEPTERQIQISAPDQESESAPENTPEDDAADRAAQRREEVIQNSQGLPQKRREIPREDPSAARAAAQKDVADKSLPAQREQKTEEQATASRESIQAQIAEQVASLPKAREKAKQIIKEITEGQRGQGSYRNDGVGEKVTITPPDGPVSTTDVSGALPDPAATTPPMEGLVGQDVEYNGNKGLLIEKDDGYYVSTQDNGDVLVESGLNKSPTELGIVPVSGNLKFENDFEIDTKTKKFNLRGEDYTLTRIIRDADGNALSLAVRDSKGKRKTIRTKSVVDRADAQMTPAPDFSQIQVEMDDLPATDQIERTPVVLKATDKKPTFKKAENYEETGEYIVTFADGDRYTLYFDDDAKEAGDEVYFTSEDGKVASLDGMLGETRQETIDELIAHRQKLIDAGENSYNTPLNPEVSSDTLFKGYNLVTDHPEGQLKLTDLRKKFRKLEDNQFDNLVERLTDPELNSEDLMVVQDGVISHPETAQEIEAERLAEERMIAGQGLQTDTMQGNVARMNDQLALAGTQAESDFASRSNTAGIAGTVAGVTANQTLGA